MLLAFFAAATVAACPYPNTGDTVVTSKRDLPPEALAAFGPLADKGEPFQVSDALPPGRPPPPFSRLISASARGCELDLTYEHGGRAHSIQTARFRFANGHWLLIRRS